MLSCNDWTIKIWKRGEVGTGRGNQSLQKALGEGEGEGKEKGKGKGKH